MNKKPKVLIITNSKDATVDYLCGCMKKASLSFLRFNTDIDLRCVSISYKGLLPKMSMYDKSYIPSDFNHVWYRRPHPLKTWLKGDKTEVVHIEAEWSEAIEGFLSHISHKCWMNHPTFNSCASHKIEQISRARSLGLIVPETIVTQDANIFHKFWNKCHGQIIVKPLASGYLERKLPKDDTLIYTSKVRYENLPNLKLLHNSPTLFQELIRKDLDVRIITVDKELHGIGLSEKNPNSNQRLDIRRDNMNGVNYKKISIPNEVKKALQKLVKSYNLRFSAIDMAIDKQGKWIFFEINPNGQWAWLDLIGGSDIASAFIRAFSKVR